MGLTSTKERKIRNARSLSLLATGVLWVFACCGAHACEGEVARGRTPAGIVYHSIGNGPSALVLHAGPGLDSTYLHPQLDRLSDLRRLTFFDQRGTGSSDMPLRAGDLTVRQFVADVESVRGSLPEAPAQIDLIGHSWGGVLALHYALHFPQRVRSIVLIDSSDGMPRTLQAFDAYLQKHRAPDDAAALGRIMAEPGFRGGNSDAYKRFFRYWFRVYFADPAKLADMTIVVPAATAKNLFAVLGALNKDAGRQSLYPLLGTLTMPVLILHGRQSPLPGAVAERLHEHLPNSHLEWIENSGHFPFIEQPRAFRFLVRSFLRAPEAVGKTPRTPRHE